MSPPEVSSIFAYLDDTGTYARRAQVNVKMGDNLCLTVRAGGLGTCSKPALSPYRLYEVLSDHEPETYWSKYADPAGLVYRFVPKLLICQHIVTHLGICDVVCGSTCYSW